ncbi:MAG: endopeptidase La [Flavobacteriaceae bacterium]|nr:endopeptidase La [Cryomorphaceae bacterium]MBL6677342.1 endopeptidase La [Flavobacteriaceae bacterium]MDA0330363.1 endopeptidase La [Bacteroidota bacterium]
MSIIFNNIDIMSLDDFSDESDFIPLMTNEDEKALEKETLPEFLPILPLTNTVLFPGVVIPINAGRDKSIRLIKDANKSSKLIGVIAQKSINDENPGIENIYEVGTVAKILRVLKMPNGNTTVIIQGKKRFKIKSVVKTDPYIQASIDSVSDDILKKSNSKFSATIDAIKDISLKIIKENPNIPSDASFAIKNIHSSAFLINFVSSNLNISIKEKQDLLKSTSIQNRAMKCLKFLNVEYEKLALKNDIQSKVRNDLDQQQREYYLQQQMKTIQEELGENSYQEDIQELIKKSKNKIWSEETKFHFEKELSKLKRMNSQVAEYSVQRNYLDLLVDLPWKNYSEDNFDLDKAQKILDKDHFGLDDVKKRIIEYLAVLKLRKDMKSPILCLYGPPGVGKTSLGKSISKSINREYVRVSLGGLRDEAEIRGHRKTYIGAMPGRIIQSIRKSGTSNPVFVLDEIDKISSGSQGDPSSALLELLDPEQNNSFHDNFLEIGYDLSKVMFVATANNLSTMHPALLDRMELINVSGYTSEEKVSIANKFLIKKQLSEHGMNSSDFKISNKNIKQIISGYTRESGVRNLEKQIAKLIRNKAKNIVSNSKYNNYTNENYLKDVLGPPKFFRDKYENNNFAGVVTGLAWTSVGGEILFIESSLSDGKGNMSITGNLGKIMKESAVIALEFIKSNYHYLGINKEIDFSKYNIHIHVPEGATPKDGPSAGITILTSLVSLFTQKRVKRNLAMTGEITLRGKVLPVGGIKEKILAAKRADIKEIILSSHNKKDIEEIDQKYLKGLNFIYVDNMIDVVSHSLTNRKVLNPKKI